MTHHVLQNVIKFLLCLALIVVVTVSRAQAQSQAQSQAQENSWVQIEAQPSLARAQESLRSYAARLPDVNGFSLGGGWYAIALGPYDAPSADKALRRLRARGAIPRDSYIAFSSDYTRQIWPVGSNDLAAPTLRIAEPQGTTPAATATETPQPLTEPSDETPREARASEAQLDRDGRAALQTALQWAGYYSGAIDAAFGPGTRNSMAGWQQANGFEATGILTTTQRAELLRQYNAVLAGLGLRLHRDTRAGIEMKLPMDVVSLEKYESPFAQYTSKGDIDATVLLISQRGDQATLGGLFDIMQTLEIVPPQGPRRLEQNSFLLIGESGLKISHTQAWLKAGEIKGFTLIWPAGDEARRKRLLGEMQESFQRLDGVLPDNAGTPEAQSIDLVSGLSIRKPKLSHSGFYVDRSGTVVTTAEVAQACGRLTIDEVYDAEITTLDAARGIAVLRPVQPLAPMSVASFQMTPPRLQSNVAVAGYSYGGVLSAPTLTFGQLADVKGLNGESGQKRLALNALQGDAGGPVVDAAGGVLGMLLPQAATGRILPEGVSLAANAESVAQVLQASGITPASADTTAPIAPETLSRKTTRMTVLVSCWE